MVPDTTPLHTVWRAPVKLSVALLKPIVGAGLTANDTAVDCGEFDAFASATLIDPLKFPDASVVLVTTTVSVADAPAATVPVDGDTASHDPPEMVLGVAVKFNGPSPLLLSVIVCVAGFRPRSVANVSDDGLMLMAGAGTLIVNATVTLWGELAAFGSTT